MKTIDGKPEYKGATVKFLGHKIYGNFPFLPFELL